MNSNRKKIILATTLAVFELFLSVHVVSARTIAPGVDYATETTSRGKTVRILTVNTQQTLTRVEGKGGGVSCSAVYRAADLDSLVNEPDFVGAVNAHFFSDGNVVKGEYVGNRVFIGPPYTDKNVSIDHDGNITAGEGHLQASQASNYSMYLSGLFRISTDGRNFTTMTDADIQSRFRSIYPSRSTDTMDRTTGSFNATGPIHRTFLGINPAEHKMILLVGGGYSLTERTALGGIAPVEGVQMLRRYGATEGYVMDSGGSSLMRLNSRLAGEGGTNSDGRGIASLIVVRTGRPQTAAQVGALPTRNCTSGSGTGTGGPGPTSAPTATGATVAPLAPISSSGGGGSVSGSGAVRLEVPIGDVNVVSGRGSIIVNYTQLLFTFTSGIIGLLALIMLIISGIRMTTGSSDQMTKAKEGITGVVAGMVLLASGGFLLYLINPCFFSFENAATCTARITSTGQSLPSGSIVSGGSSGPGPRSASDSPASSYRQYLPSVWGNGHKSEGLRRFNSFGAEFERISGAVFPGTPPEAVMGFALNGSIFENTTGFRTGLPDEHIPNPPAGVECMPSGRSVSSQRFHELGMFGVEGGTRCGPAPAAGSNWVQTAQSAEVQAILGRSGCTSPGCWVAVPDQLAIGMINTRNHGRNVARQLPANIRPSSENTQWFAVLAFMGWSAGDGGTRNHIMRFASELAAVPENQRWGTWLRLVATNAESGQIPPCHQGEKHRCVMFSAMRTLQKMEAGLILARDRGGNVGWWEDGLGDDRVNILDTITRYGHIGYPG